MAWHEKLNLTQQKHTFTNQKKCTTTQNKHKQEGQHLLTEQRAANFSLLANQGAKCTLVMQ